MKPKGHNRPALPFTRSVEEHDRQTIAFWRDASPEAHADAMIQLSEYAAAMAALTGLNKQNKERFPGFVPVAAAPRELHERTGT